jgi:hypothetical protein
MGVDGVELERHKFSTYFTFKENWENNKLAVRHRIWRHMKSSTEIFNKIAFNSQF